MAFPWKKPFFDKLTISSRLAEGRRVNYISPKVLSCSGLHAPKRQAELGFLPQLPTLTDLLKDHPTISLPTSTTELPGVQNLSQAAKPGINLPTATCDARIYSQNSL